MTPLSEKNIQQGLATQTFGQRVIFKPQIGSTNVALKALAQDGAAEGLLYLTDEQTLGKGRLQRQWHAPAGSSLLMSLLFRPPETLQPMQVPRLTMACALSLLEAIEHCCGISPQLKWPNDLVWTDRKKLAGILTEFELDETGLNWVIVGLGVNVNLDFEQMDLEADGLILSQTATSLSTIVGHAVDRLPLLQQFLAAVERRYQRICQGESPYQEWASHLINLGEFVTVSHVDGSQESGHVDGANEDGALLLRQADGSILSVWAGDVTLRR